MRRLIRGRPRPPRRRGHDDRGAAAALVAVLLSGGVLLGMAALSVDVGQLYAERRQVQNGADAAALAVAMGCAASTRCDTSTTGTARTLADANANDGATVVQGVCGRGRGTLPACGTAGSGSLTECPAPPSGVDGWVDVRTGTLTPGGGTLLPPTFAQVLAGNAGYQGTQVQACAQAAWGAPTQQAQTFPITLSLCEWYAATANGTAYAPTPPYPPYPPGEVALKLHSTSNRGGCPSSGGAFADLPGGFGWLDGGGTCQLAVQAAGTVAADPGVSASSCPDQLAARVGTILYLPVYSDAWGSGSSGTYRVSGFAAFYLSGYNLPGAHPPRVASPAGGNLCRGSDKCIYGWFTQGLLPVSTTIGPGPGFGADVVALTG
jgi:Flp pilus assembly protein TadG